MEIRNFRYEQQIGKQVYLFEIESTCTETRSDKSWNDNYALFIEASRKDLEGLITNKRTMVSGSTGGIYTFHVTNWYKKPSEEKEEKK